MRRTGTRQRRDGGYALVLLALVLVVLMGFTALAIDLGGLYNNRRQDQSAADAGALAGIQDIALIADAAQKAKEYTASSLDLDVGDLDWNDCPSAADDPGRLPLTVTGAACITYNHSLTQLRVRVPTQRQDALFASVLGFSEFTHSASATAERLPVGFGGVLPFGLPGGSGGLVCPKTPPAGLSFPPCSGPDSGSFGFIDIGWWFRVGSSPPSCPPGGGGNRLPDNIAAGADHQIRLHAPSTAILPDATYCSSRAEIPNALNAGNGVTGNMPSQLGAGLYATSAFRDGDGGRLTRSDSSMFNGASSPSWPRRLTHAIGTTELDITPLWYFLDPTPPSGAPASCRRDVFVDSAGNPKADLSGLVPNFPTAEQRTQFKDLVEDRVGTNQQLAMIALMERCFTHFKGDAWGEDGWSITPPEPSTCNPCNGPIFTTPDDETEGPWDIQFSPRFGYVPEFAPNWQPSNADDPIVRFRAIYIQASCLENSAACSSNDSVLHAGFANGSATNLFQSGGFIAWAFVDGMLPGTLGDPDAPSRSPNVEYLLIR